MPAEESPDTRCKLELALAALAKLLRADPTLPADLSAPSQACAAALREDAAVQLPAKHCAFRDCSWQGSTDLELLKHLAQKHAAALDAVASRLPAAYSEEERRASAYNEAIAVVVREGAPLAAYAIDRRCLFNYTEALSDDGVEALELGDPRDL